MGPAPARRDRGFLLRVLRGDPAVDVEQMLDGERHSPQSGAHVADVFDRTLDHLDLDCHLSASLCREAPRVDAPELVDFALVHSTVRWTDDVPDRELQTAPR